MKRKLIAFFVSISMILSFLGLAAPIKETQMSLYHEIHKSTTKNNETVVYYSNSNWNQAYIHYRVNNGNWTTVPGVKMASSTEQSGYTWKYVINLGNETGVEVCFNNGNGSWDSRNSSNYPLGVGTYGIKNENISSLSSPIITCVPTTPNPNGNQTVVYYSNSNWNQAYIHYRVNNGNWTTVPGVKMTSTTEQSGYTWKYVINLGNETGVEVCFNNGNGSWDSRNSSNYPLGTGTYGIKNQVTSVLAAPTNSPNNNQTIVYYSNSNWNQAYIHYKVNNGNWTTVPGVKMTSTTEQSGYTWKYVINLGNETGVQVCFNNGNGSWDSKNSSNYPLGTGTYGIKNQTTNTLVLPTVTPTITPTVTPTVTPYLDMKYGKKQYSENDTLPAYVDLREDQDLPPIVNQGDVGSCASEAITYMQFTNAVSKYVRYNNVDGYYGVSNIAKNWNPSQNENNRFSDRWTYHFAGSGTAWVCKVLMENGAPLLSDYSFPLRSDGGYTYLKNGQANPDAIAWDVTEKTMTNALNTRLGSYDQHWIKNYNYKLTPSLLKKIKCSLANGNVVVTGSTAYDSFLFNEIENGGNSNATGQKAAVAAKPSAAGHQFAIIGYDDNITATYCGETLKGGFLVANSWGTSYGNNGCIWIMYDAVNNVSENANITEAEKNMDYMGLVGTNMSFLKTGKDWKVTKNSTVTVKGVTYPTYDLQDNHSGNYLTYEKSGTKIYLSSVKSKQCEWCFIPYKTACTWSEFNNNNYDSSYDNTYLIYEVNKDSSISETGYRYLDAGTRTSQQGRGIGTASLNGGAYPKAKCWSVPNTTTGEKFETSFDIIDYKGKRIYALDQFVFTDWREIQLGLPERMVQFEITTANRLSFDIVLSRTDKNGNTATYKPHFSDNKSVLENAYSTNLAALNFDGYLSSSGSATGTFIISYENLLKNISGSPSDYTWQLSISPTSKLKTSLAGNTIKVKNVKLLDENKNVLDSISTQYDVTNNSKTWTFSEK